MADAAPFGVDIARDAPRVSLLNGPLAGKLPTTYVEDNILSDASNLLYDGKIFGLFI